MILSISEGKDKTYSNIKRETIYGYDLDSKEAILKEVYKGVNFVFHLAGVNCPKTEEQFMQGNS